MTPLDTIEIDGKKYVSWEDYATKDEWARYYMKLYTLYGEKRRMENINKRRSLLPKSKTICKIHNCIEIVDLGDGTCRCFLCETEREYFSFLERFPRVLQELLHIKEIKKGYEAWKAGEMEKTFIKPKLTNADEQQRYDMFASKALSRIRTIWRSLSPR